MPYHYVEDYEEVTGKKPEPAPADTMTSAAVKETTAKVVEAPMKAPAKKAAAKVETKRK